MALFRKKAARVVRRGAVEEPSRTQRGQKASGSKSRNNQRSGQQHRERTPKRNNARSGAQRRGAPERTGEKRRTTPHGNGFRP